MNLISNLYFYFLVLENCIKVFISLEFIVINLEFIVINSDNTNNMILL